MKHAPLCLLGSLCLVIAAHAQALDQSRPIRIVVASPPGGTTDAVARAIGERLAGKATFIVENKPGASGHIGWSTVASAVADGQTLLLDYRFNDTTSMRTAVYLGEVPLVLVSSRDSQLTSLRDVMSEAKKTPVRINFGNPGNGTPAYAALQRLQEMARFEVTSVQYKGSIQALQDLMGNQVQLAFVSLKEGLDAERTGKVRILGVSSDKRLPGEPHIPTLAEAGSPGFQYQLRYRLMVPASAPFTVDEQLRRLVSEAFKGQDAQVRLWKLGLVYRPDGSGTPGKEPCPKNQKECPNGACIPKEDTCPKN